MESVEKSSNCRSVTVVPSIFCSGMSMFVNPLRVKLSKFAVYLFCFMAYVPMRLSSISPKGLIGMIWRRPVIGQRSSSAFNITVKRLVRTWSACLVSASIKMVSCLIMGLSPVYESGGKCD